MVALCSGAGVKAAGSVACPFRSVGGGASASPSAGPGSSATLGRAPRRHGATVEPRGRASRPLAAASCRGGPDSGLSMTCGGLVVPAGGVRERGPRCVVPGAPRTSARRAGGGLAPVAAAVRSEAAISLCSACARGVCGAGGASGPSVPRPTRASRAPASGALLWLTSDGAAAQCGVPAATPSPSASGLLPAPVGSSAGAASGAPWSTAMGPVPVCPTAREASAPTDMGAPALPAATPGPATSLRAVAGRRLPSASEARASETARSSATSASSAPEAMVCVVDACAFCTDARSCRRVPG